MYRYPGYTMPSTSPAKSPGTIEVLGEGATTVTPNQAVIVLGAITEGSVLPSTQSDNAKIITNVINSLLHLNIPREKIQTYDYDIQTQYDYQEGKQIFRGYKVTHLLQITNEVVEQTGIIVDAAVAQGANHITSISFTTSHPEFHKNAALSHAIQNAYQKAMTIAAAMGVTLLTVPSRVQEVFGAAEPTPYAASLSLKSAVTPIQTGQLTIQAKVRVWYLFAER
ncbi:SIMPL domain-containing protein [Paenibacillus sp. SYP-B3998]|uniref:SIMPL domain-containing protein n=1 Tax=Paenibacillus sp. SYP-B3998 TaxID=2678564 RepID=A0A6G3ZRT5_9BACL|nr:SIMPL domain-containing protein [Paenibacillus sp. SYP-B3998]NEW04748.1 SIMPL domain-containing protein [Paenibacillus sp. SYP-B3998]